MKHTARKFMWSGFAVGFMGLLLLIAPYGVQGQGELTPTSPPAPSMKTLEQIYQQDESNRMYLAAISNDMQNLFATLQAIQTNQVALHNQMQELANQNAVTTNILFFMIPIVIENNQMLQWTTNKLSNP